MKHPMGSQSYQLGPVGQVDSSASLQVGREAGHLVGPGVGHLVDPEVGHLVDLEVGHLEDQVVGSSLSGHQEVDPVGVDRLDRHGSLG